MSDLLGITVLIKGLAESMHTEHAMKLEQKRAKPSGAARVDFPAAAACIPRNEMAPNGGGLDELTFLPKLDLNLH